MPHEMIMIGEDRPCFELPAKLCGYFQQAPVEDSETVRATKMMLFKKGAGGEKIGATGSELMHGRVRPEILPLTHGTTITEFAA
jgi:hypothetical protein